MEQPQQILTTALSECEKEQIHLIDSVQPHGALLVFGEPALNVLQASANSASILGLSYDSMVGQLAKSFLSDDSITVIQKILSSNQNNDFWPAVSCSLSTLQPQMRFQGMLHRYNGMCILELEQEANPNVEELVALRNLLVVDLGKLFVPRNATDLLKLTATNIQRITGFDRILIYKFDDEWHGAVIAEQKRDFMNSYVNQRFPASDIPSQARDLYAKNMIRVLASVNAEPSPITPLLNPNGGTRLDLTYSILRSMSPIHIEYLKNMGVSASMSISLMVKDKLWGLIVCHHKTAKIVEFGVRSTCQLVAKIVSGLVERIEEHEVTRGYLRLELAAEEIIFNLSKSEKVTKSLLLQLPSLMAVTNASGVALISDDILELHGTTPAAEAVRDVFVWLRDIVQKPIFTSERLSLDYPQWDGIAYEASGLIAVDISATNSLWILWFRPEQIEELSWAGNPYKPVESNPGQAFIHPRRSFALWQEVVRGRSLAWKSFEKQMAASVQNRICGLILAEVVRNEKQKKLLRQRREDILAVVTHDLKVPFIAMERLLPPLIADQSGKVSEDLREILSVMDKANQKQGARINKLLQMLVYELGSAELKTEQIDCLGLIEASIAEFVLQPGQTVEIISTVEQEGYSFKSDRASVESILKNLFDNAVRATGNGGLIQVFYECSALGLTVQVKDSGLGISLSDQKDLFDRFWQGGESRPRAAQIGIGLYLCKRIVEALNGTITCESAPGKGTTFAFFIPNA